MNAIVAHNDLWTRVVLAEILSEAGYTVTEASNGMAALRLAQRSIPELLILDVALAEIAGDEVVEALRAEAGTRGISAILVRGREGALASLGNVLQPVAA